MLISFSSIFQGIAESGDYDEQENRGRHIFLASGPWQSNSASFGSCTTSTRSVSINPIDISKLRIHSADVINKPTRNPFNDEIVPKRYVLIEYGICLPFLLLLPRYLPET